MAQTGRWRCSDRPCRGVCGHNATCPFWMRAASREPASAKYPPGPGSEEAPENKGDPVCIITSLEGVVPRMPRLCHCSQTPELAVNLHPSRDTRRLGRGEGAHQKLTSETRIPESATFHSTSKQAAEPVKSIQLGEAQGRGGSVQTRHNRGRSVTSSLSYAMSARGQGPSEMSAVWKETLMLILKNKVLFYLLSSRAEHFQHKLIILTTTKPTAFSHTRPFSLKKGVGG